MRFYVIKTPTQPYHLLTPTSLLRQLRLRSFFPYASSERRATCLGHTGSHVNAASTLQSQHCVGRRWIGCPTRYRERRPVHSIWRCDARTRSGLRLFVGEVPTYGVRDGIETLLFGRFLALMKGFEIGHEYTKLPFLIWTTDSRSSVRLPKLTFDLLCNLIIFQAKLQCNGIQLRLGSFLTSESWFSTKQRTLILLQRIRPQ